jgi:hypothetical protein
MDIRRAGDRGNGIPYLKLSSILCKNKREMRKEMRIFVNANHRFQFREGDFRNQVFRGSAENRRLTPFHSCGAPRSNQQRTGWGVRAVEDQAGE